MVGNFFTVKVWLPSCESESGIPEVRMPSAVIAPMIEKTPTTMESIVKKARSLFERSALSAILIFSVLNDIIRTSMHQPDRAAKPLAPERYRKQDRSRALR